MAGLKKIKVYQYDLNGKFIETYDSMSEVRAKYFPKDTGKRPLFTDKNYKLLTDGTIVSCEKIGRTGIREIVKRENNPYLSFGNIVKEVVVYNLDNKKVATFASMSIASKMTGIDLGTIHNRLYRGSKHGNKDGLYFKYK